MHMMRLKEEKERQSMARSSKKQTLKSKDILEKVKEVLGK